MISDWCDCVRCKEKYPHTCVIAPSKDHVCMFRLRSDTDFKKKIKECEKIEITWGLWSGRFFVKNQVCVTANLFMDFAPADFAFKITHKIIEEKKNSLTFGEFLGQFMFELIEHEQKVWLFYKTELQTRGVFCCD